MSKEVKEGSWESRGAQKHENSVVCEISQPKIAPCEIATSLRNYFAAPKSRCKNATSLWNYFAAPHLLSVKIFAAAKHPFGTWVPFRSPVHSFRSCEMVAKSPHLKILQRTHHEGNVAAAPLLDTFQSTSWSPFHAYHMSFQILGSQESRTSNGAQFGVETKKLWLFEDNCIKLWENFTVVKSGGKISQLWNQLRNKPSLEKSTCAISDICHRLG